MDISKIRKKAKELGADKVPAAKSVPEKSPEPAADSTIDHIPEPSAETQDEENAPAVAADKAAEPSVAVSKDELTGLTEGEVQTELLTFMIGREEFAFRVDEVEEILRLQKITYVPTLPDYVKGITSLRGKIIPVIGLNSRLGLKRADAQPEEKYEEIPGTRQDAKILIISAEKGIIGAMVDRVVGVVGISKESIIEPPAHLTEAELKYIEGVVILDKRFIAVIRADETMDIEI